MLNVSNYYGSLLDLAGHAVIEGFVRETHRRAIVVSDDADALLEGLISAPALQDIKWTNPT